MKRGAATDVERLLYQYPNIMNNGARPGRQGESAPTSMIHRHVMLYLALMLASVTSTTCYVKRGRLRA
jgi:hypothetical protein